MTSLGSSGLRRDGEMAGAGPNPPASTADPARLRARLAVLSAQEAMRLLLDLVCQAVAGAQRSTDTTGIDADRSFRDLGVDSMMATEICDRLSAATGLPVPAAILFSHPTPGALSGYLRGALATDGDALSTVNPTAVGVAAAPTTHGAGGDDPIVIVGAGCRFPGGVAGPDDLWRILVEGRDVTSDLPADRGWDLAAMRGAGRSGSVTGRGGFLSDIAGFDAAFFGISPREAVAMDPQQRLLLEVSWEALERAGIDPHTLRGTSTGVFIGTNGQDYLQLALAAREDLVGLAGTGSAASVASGRLGYVLGLEGPAVTVDTASSASLVALHLAVRSLRAGECEAALAGGVTVMCTPMSFAEHTRQGGLSPDGRSKSYAACADGTAWSEGAGVVVLERLSAARRLGHEVWAVVRGSAINADGASNGLTAPSGSAQRRVIELALADAGVSPAEVDAVEGHGSGTRLGDPIEIGALLDVYGRGRTVPLRLGSVKSNLGHTQAAGGIAGVLKMVLALRHGLLPRTLHVDAPTERVDWSAGSVSLLTEPAPWPQAGRPRRAGVSSFGISGTNAHVILEQPPPSGTEPVPAPAPATNPESVAGPESITVPVPAAPATGDPAPAVRCGGTVPWTLSARSDAALRDQAARLIAHLDERPDLPVAWVGWSLATHRAHLTHRATVLGGDPVELRHGLRAVAGAAAAPGVVRGQAIGAGNGVVFMFPGQGAQWWGMGRELMATSGVFAAEIQRCADALAPHVDWPVVDVITGVGDPELLRRVDVVQPALFSMMVALARLWRACGVEPSAVVGHSQGEIAAACVAGALSLPDAAAAVALRSRALVGLPGQGGMAAVALAPARVTELLDEWHGRLSVAAVNGPSSVVVSGPAPTIDELLTRCERDGVRSRRIAVDYASHSGQVDQVRDELLDALSGLRPGRSAVAFYSTVTGGRIDDTAALDAAYWFTNLRHTVQMEQAVRALLADGHRILIEVSPHPMLAAGVQETLDAAASHGAGFVATLRRQDGGPGRWLMSLADAYVRGAGVDWAAVLPRPRPVRVDLPTYPFQRQRYWPTPGAAASPQAATPSGQAPAAGDATAGDAMARDAAAESPAAQPAVSLAQRLADLGDGERVELLAELVCAEAAAILGHTSADSVTPHDVFKETGFESMTAVELSNRLRAVTGLPLPASLAFDYPTPLLVAGYLARNLATGVAADRIPRNGSVTDLLDALEAALGEISATDAGKAATVRLEAILSKLRKPDRPTTKPPVVDDIETVSVNRLLDLIDEEFDLL